MDTVFAEPKIENTTEARAGSAGACFGTDLKEAAKRVEKGINNSKAAVSAKLEDGKIAAERLLKHSRYAVEDGIEETSYQIKRHPLRFFAIAFAAGAAVGFLIPHLGHNTHKANPSY
jgi:ElaB/YqjD/DUF883 family membrane-anchored ribosome-binding protein